MIDSRKLGKLLNSKLQRIQKKYPNYISHVMGQGLLAALHFNTPQRKPLSGFCSEICELAMQRGLLLVHTGRETIKLAPPLCINEDALSEGLSVLDKTISDLTDIYKV